MSGHRDDDRIARLLDCAAAQPVALGSHDEGNPRILAPTFVERRELIQWK